MKGGYRRRSLGHRHAEERDRTHSRPNGQNVWRGKSADVMGASTSAVCTVTAQQHLRSIGAYLDVPTLGKLEIFIQTEDVLFEGGNIRSFCKAGWAGSSPESYASRGEQRHADGHPKCRAVHRLSQSGEKDRARRVHPRLCCALVDGPREPLLIVHPRSSWSSP